MKINRHDETQGTSIENSWFYYTNNYFHLRLVNMKIIKMCPLNMTTILILLQFRNIKMPLKHKLQYTIQSITRFQDIAIVPSMQN